MGDDPSAGVSVELVSVVAGEAVAAGGVESGAQVAHLKAHPVSEERPKGAGRASSAHLPQTFRGVLFGGGPAGAVVGAGAEASVAGGARTVGVPALAAGVD